MFYIDENLKRLLLFKVDETTFNKIKYELTDKYFCIQQTRSILELIRLLETFTRIKQMKILKAITILLNDIELTLSFEFFEKSIEQTQIVDETISDDVDDDKMADFDEEDVIVVQEQQHQPQSIYQYHQQQQQQQPFQLLDFELAESNLNLTLENLINLDINNPLEQMKANEIFLRDTPPPSSSSSSSSSPSNCPSPLNALTPKKIDNICNCLINELGTCWRKFAEELGLKQYKINEIEYLSSGSHKRCTEKMLNYYFENNEINIHEFCNSLKMIGRNQLQRKLCQFLC